MTTPAPIDPLQIYLATMEDIKARLLIVKQITEGRSPLEDEGHDGEIVCLMLRKILEQIAFASLVAHKDAYSAVHNDADQTWRAKRLLERLAEIHPSFWPKAVRPSSKPQAEGHHHFDEAEDYLTQDEFVFLYDMASGGLHTWNPYKSGPRVLNFERSVADWVGRIIALLDTHWIQLLGTEESWLVQMDNPEDHKVHAFRAQPVNPEDAPSHAREAHYHAVGLRREDPV
jgi:hypothetical protein